MLDFINKDYGNVTQIWFTTAMVVMFIITLPLMVLVLPAYFAISIVNDLIGDKPANKDKNVGVLFGNDDPFTKWTSFFDIKKPKGWE